MELRKRLKDRLRDNESVEQVFPILDVEISWARRAGNSTRQIDKAVSILFEKGEVEVLDHAYAYGNSSPELNLDLADRILRRLAIEHRLVTDPKKSEPWIKYHKAKNMIMLIRP